MKPHFSQLGPFSIGLKAKILLLLSAIYGFTTLPFGYFRNDDWLMLGNGVLRLPQDWSFAFKSTWFVGKEEAIWFFRPFFKIFIYVFYSLFGYHYGLWLVATLIFTLAALWFGAKTMELLTDTKSKALAFLVLFAASFHLHFGSVVWMGEGLMNCPQVFFLFLNLYLFCKGTLEEKKSLSVAAFVLFAFSLGFKEAAIFHPLFLLGLLVSQAKFQRLSLPRKARAFLPYAVLSGFYLVYRLLFLPLNPNYSPHWNLQEMGVPMGILAVSLGLPLMVSILVLRFQDQTKVKNFIGALRGLWVFLPFLALAVAPYLGHPFFSPGWLLTPGIYFIFILAGALPLPESPRRFLNSAGMALLVLTLVPIGLQLRAFGWWDWHKSQRQILDIFQAQPEAGIQAIVIYSCANPQFPSSTLERVVGSVDGLYEVWALNHAHRVPVEIRACEDIPNPTQPSKSQLSLKWRFPEFSILGT